MNTNQVYGMVTRHKSVMYVIMVSFSNRRYREGEFVLTRYEPNPLPAVITEVVVI